MKRRISYNDPPPATSYLYHRRSCRSSFGLHSFGWSFSLVFFFWNSVLARGLMKMKREKEEERKSAAFVGLFPSVLPVLDTLRYIGQSLA